MNFMEKDVKLKIEEIPLFELMESNFSGCPICYLNFESVRKTIFSILYESVNDPEIRARLREDGFCHKHARLIFQVLEESPDLGLLGISIILKDLLDSATELNTIKRPSRGKKERDHSHECYFCKIEKDANKRHISVFARTMTDHSKRTIFERSESVLCFYHTAEIANVLSGTPVFEEFLRIQEEKLRMLSLHLESFIAKHDYRNTLPFTSDEASAWKKHWRSSRKE